MFQDDKVFMVKFYNSTKYLNAVRGLLHTDMALTMWYTNILYILSDRATGIFLAIKSVPFCSAFLQLLVDFINYKIHMNHIFKTCP